MKNILSFLIIFLACKYCIAQPTSKMYATVRGKTKGEISKKELLAADGLTLMNNPDSSYRIVAFDCSIYGKGLDYAQFHFDTDKFNESLKGMFKRLSAYGGDHVDFTLIKCMGPAKDTIKLPPLYFVTKENKPAEDKIYDLVAALPEVEERGDYIEKHTNGVRHLRIWIYQTPKETKRKYYWVKVGEDNGINFVSHFNFYVDSETYEIRFFDTVKNTVISLDDWRKENRH